MDEQATVSSPGNSNKLLLVIGIVVLLILGAGGFFLYNKSHKASAPQQTTQNVVATTQPSPTQEATTAATGTATAAEKTFTITGQNFSFTPNAITVNKGDEVTIIFKDEGGFHNFMIDGYNVKTSTIQSGNSSTVSFVADKAGTFAFYCGVPGHRENGMTGTLTVK